MTLTQSERGEIQKLLSDAKTTLASAQATLVSNQKKLETARTQYDGIIHAAYLPGVTLTDQIVLLGITITVVVDPFQTGSGNLYFAYFDDGNQIFNGHGPVAAALWTVLLTIASASTTPFTKAAGSGRLAGQGYVTTSHIPGILFSFAKPLLDLPPAIAKGKSDVQQAQVLVDSLTDIILHA